MASAPPTFSDDGVAAILHGFRLRGSQPDSAMHALDAAFTGVCGESREQSFTPAQVVVAFRTVWNAAPRPDNLTFLEWSRFYHEALGRCLAIYFAMGEPT